MSLEQELVDSLSRHDEQLKRDVFHRIYEQFHKLVWFCVYRFLGNKDDTDEVSDDVFVKFYFRMDKTEIKNIKYYLTRSARNLSLNKLRDKKPTEQLDENIVGEYSFDDGNDLLKEVEKLTTKEEFEMICRHVLEGYSLVEISNQLNESLNTIKSKYRRVIKRLQSKLGGFPNE